MPPSGRRQTARGGGHCGPASGETTGRGHRTRRNQGSRWSSRTPSRSQRCSRTRFFVARPYEPGRWATQGEARTGGPANRAGAPAVATLVAVPGVAIPLAVPGVATLVAVHFAVLAGSIRAPVLLMRPL